MSALDHTVADALYESELADDWKWIPLTGAAKTVRGIFDEGLMQTVRDEGKPDVYNPDAELKVRRCEVAADQIKKGDSFIGCGITYKVRSHDILNTTELNIKLTKVL